MSTFIQLHLLTAYPPANLNRDDLGRPKTARMGGVDRLRVSSQSLKRTWRTSDLFQQALSGHVGTRTKRLGTEIYYRLVEGDVKPKSALEWARTIADVFGKLKTTDINKAKQEERDSEDAYLERLTAIEQLAHVSPEERAAVDALADKLIEESRAPEPDELRLLRHRPSAADIALFGRMLAADPGFNVEAACQVAHAITVHQVAVEDDYFTAVDDLNSDEDDMGAGHIGETGFAAGLFYSYICINRDQLAHNLGGDEELADRAISAIAEAAVKVSPRGKQNSFGSRAYASYVLAEKGSQQPRSLSVSFLKPVDGSDHAAQAIDALESQQTHFDTVYGACADGRYVLNAQQGTGSMDELRAFLAHH